MNRQTAEKIITEYLKPVFGFALKRCRTVEDAEDLSQEIVLRAFRALLLRDDIRSPGKFIWTIAHNSLTNYYRATARSMVGVSMDEVAEHLADPDAAADATADAALAEDNGAVLQRLQGEIAYLSALQRKIVIAYYFENRKQAEIAEQLGIPLGTVKWHLFEAKKELKRGLGTMRNTSELKFNPVKFRYMGINGTPGTKSPDEFFRSALAQNICYCVRNEAKTVNEIADDLGVSPVYVESEAELLEENGFLLEESGRYLSNFIISEPTKELLILQDEMYKKAAELFANELYDTLISTGILEDDGILCHQTDESVSLTEGGRTDRNFLLWTLIPYIAALSGEELMEERISFQEVATIRPDGGQNIFTASVLPEKPDLPEGFVQMNNWCGPMWNGTKTRMLWQIDSQWSDRPSVKERNFPEECERVLTLHRGEEDNGVSKFDYAWLTERGYVKTVGDPDGSFKSVWQIVILENQEIHNKLLALGESIKRKHQAEFDGLKAPYAKAVLDSVPAHLRKMREYELQFVFHSDGWFLLHCIVCLLNNGKLKPPTEGQRKALTTLMINH